MGTRHALNGSSIGLHRNPLSRDAYDIPDRQVMSSEDERILS